jgi:hypothetical protein
MGRLFIDAMPARKQVHSCLVASVEGFEGGLFVDSTGIKPVPVERDGARRTRPKQLRDDLDGHAFEQ